MRILVVSPFQPHPDADHGGAVYLGVLLKALAKEAECCCVAFQQRGRLPEIPGVQLHLLPLPANAELGAAQLLRRRIRLARDWTLGRLPLVVAKHRSQEFRRLLHKVQQDFRPQVAMLEFAVMAQYLPDLQGCPRVFTDHEHGQAIPANLGPGSMGQDRDARLWQAYQQRYYPQAELLQALSSEDAQALQQSMGPTLQKPVGIRPPLVAVPKQAVQPAQTAQVMLFLGDYRHHPNPEAAAILAHQVLPLVRQKAPQAELWLAGPGGDANLQALQGQPGVRLLGFVADLPQLLGQARCLVSPMYSGSGVRIKSLTALAHGLPVVSNQLGLQGIAAPEPAVARGEDALSLAAASLRFMQDAEAAGIAGAAGRQWAAQNLGAQLLIQEQLARFQSLETHP